MLSSVELLIDFLRHFHSPWASHADGGGVGAILSGLPDSLELLYRELGHLMLIAPGQDGRRPFGTQDLLCPPNRLDGSDGHWTIAWENSGTWSARCQRDMSDPPVFSDATSRFEGVTPATFEEVCPRVSDFLTTLCLHEAVMSCSSLVNTRSQAGVEALLRNPIEPVWLNGCYVDGPPGRSFFASSDREILVLVREDDVWVGSPFVGSSRRYAMRTTWLSSRASNAASQRRPLQPRARRRTLFRRGLGGEPAKVAAVARVYVMPREFR